MDKKLLDRLMWIAITGMFLAAIIFICLFLFSSSGENIFLFAAIACNVLAGLFNCVRQFIKK